MAGGGVVGSAGEGEGDGGAVGGGVEAAVVEERGRGCGAAVGGVQEGRGGVHRASLVVACGVTRTARETESCIR